MNHQVHHVADHQCVAEERRRLVGRDTVRRRRHRVHDEDPLEALLAGVVARSMNARRSVASRTGSLPGKNVFCPMTYRRAERHQDHRENKAPADQTRDDGVGGFPRQPLVHEAVGVAGRARPMLLQYAAGQVDDGLVADGARGLPRVHERKSDQFAPRSRAEWRRRRSPRGARAATSSEHDAATRCAWEPPCLGRTRLRARSSLSREASPDGSAAVRHPIPQLSVRAVLCHPGTVEFRARTVESEPVARFPRPPQVHTSSAERLAGLAAHIAGPQFGPELTVGMPFTGEVLGEVPRCKPADVRAAFERARRRRRRGRTAVRRARRVFPASTTCSSSARTRCSI